MLGIKLFIDIKFVILFLFQINAHVIHEKGCNTCLSATCVREAVKILDTIDESVSPCDDFYQFACGKWIESTVLPAHKTSITRFIETQDDLNDKLRGLLEKTYPKNESRDFVIKAKNYYESCMNTTLIEKLGDKPLLDLLKDLGEWPVVFKSKWNELHWTDLYIRLRKTGLINSMLFSLSVEADIRNNSRKILIIKKPSFGLFDKNLLLKGDKDPVISAYRNLMVKSAIKLGANKDFVNKTIDEILHFEILLANISVSKRKTDFKLRYNRMTIEELNQFTPHIDWLKIIRNFISNSITKYEELVTYDTSFITALDSLLEKTNNKTLANYIIWRVIQTKLTSLSTDWIEIKKEFDSVVYGTKTSTPRWEQCLAFVEISMGKALSNLYVKNFFNEENKRKALEMVSNVKKEFKKTLNMSEWMSKGSLEHALRKLQNMKLLVGYPEQLINDSIISAYYELLNITLNDYFGNRQKITKWATDLVYNRLRQPNDLHDWRELGPVAEVNAAYHEEKNMVMIPAGILQGIFYNKDRPDYLNYGTIAKSAGHEITHGFDIYGRQYDENGELNNWWDLSTDQKYRTKAQCFIDQYNNYTVEEIAINVNGIKTLGENIADNGGIKLAFMAYLNFVQNNGPELQLPALEYTSEQLFWISYGVHYCAKQTNEYLKFMVQTDAHTPNRQRINGVLSNSKEFSKSFNCSIGSHMNPINKCHVW